MGYSFRSDEKRASSCDTSTPNSSMRHWAEVHLEVRVDASERAAITKFHTLVASSNSQHSKKKKLDKKDEEMVKDQSCDEKKSRHAKQRVQEVEESDDASSTIWMALGHMSCDSIEVVDSISQVSLRKCSSAVLVRVVCKYLPTF
jgi:hypothetical protein